MSKRRRSALTTLALAVAALFALPASPASAGSATTANACANSVTANFSQISVVTSGDDGLTSVAPGGTTTTTGLSQQAAIPGAIFVAGYNLGLLVQGTNNVPANVRSTIEATNTADLDPVTPGVQNAQNTNTVGGTPPNGTVSVSTTITDPDGSPGTGDETATDASFSVTYNNLTWTAGASGTIDYRQQSIAAAPPTAANNALLINALVGGVFNVQFRCAPGTVTPPDPGIITLIDPAGSFDTTNIVAPNTAPTANAGADQTVASGATVQLDGTGSTDPENNTLTYAWTQTSGPTVTLAGANTATPTFTAPTGPADLTFDLQVCDPAPLCDTDSVSVHVNAPVNTAPTANAGVDQMVASGATVQLDGTGSTDPENNTLTYAWTQTSGPTVTLAGANTATPTFTAPTGPADLTFDLEVCDPAPLCDTDSVSVHVNAPAVSSITINNAAVTEGNSGQTAMTFTVSLSAAQAAQVTVGFATADGPVPPSTDGATAPTDYTSATGTVTFAPGVTAQPVTVLVNGDTTVEPDETFAVNLSNAIGNATITDSQGTGVIVNDDVANQAPTANAGPDQTVASGATVNLAGSGTDPENQALTFAWTQTAGPTVTLSDPSSATPSFTAPTGPATLTFQLEVCDPEPLCDTDSVTINVQAPPMIDASGDVIVNGPVSHTKTAKNFVFKVSNVGTTSITINPGDITSSVDVNGTTTGSVSAAGLPVTIGPGASKRLKLSWSYGSALVGGETVVFNACVNLTGDIDTTNDCSSATVTAK